MKLDIGCGQNKQRGFFGIDFEEESEADFIHDLNIYPYPFEDSSVDEIYCRHTIEHIIDPLKFLEEIWRISRDNAKIIIIFPHFTRQGNFIGHVSHIPSFLFRESYNYNFKYSNMKFDTISTKFNWRIINSTETFFKFLFAVLNIYANVLINLHTRFIDLSPIPFWVGGIEEVKIEALVIK